MAMFGQCSKSQGLWWGARPLNCITRNSNTGMYYKSNESCEYQNCLHPPIQKFSSTVKRLLEGAYVNKVQKCSKYGASYAGDLWRAGWLFVLKGLFRCAINVPVKRREGTHWLSTTIPSCKYKEIHQDCRCKMSEMIRFWGWIFKKKKSLYCYFMTVIRAIGQWWRRYRREESDSWASLLIQWCDCLCGSCREHVCWERGIQLSECSPSERLPPPEQPRLSQLQQQSAGEQPGRCCQDGHPPAE